MHVSGSFWSLTKAFRDALGAPRALGKKAGEPGKEPGEELRRRLDRSLEEAWGGDRG